MCPLVCFSLMFIYEVGFFLSFAGCFKYLWHVPPPKAFWSDQDRIYFFPSIWMWAELLCLQRCPLLHICISARWNKQGVVECLYMSVATCMCLLVSVCGLQVCMCAHRFKCCISHRLTVKEQKLQWEWQHSLFHSHAWLAYNKASSSSSSQPSPSSSLFPVSRFSSAPLSSCHLLFCPLFYYDPHWLFFLPTFQSVTPPPLLFLFVLLSL